MIVGKKIVLIFCAEREGFEPSVPFWGTHTFQACAFDHSAISPLLVKKNCLYFLKATLKKDCFEIGG